LPPGGPNYAPPPRHRARVESTKSKIDQLPFSIPPFFLLCSNHHSAARLADPPARETLDLRGSRPQPPLPPPLVGSIAMSGPGPRKKTLVPEAGCFGSQGRRTFKAVGRGNPPAEPGRRRRPVDPSSIIFFFFLPSKTFISKTSAAYVPADKRPSLWPPDFFACPFLSFLSSQHPIAAGKKGGGGRDDPAHGCQLGGPTPPAGGRAPPLRRPLRRKPRRSFGTKSSPETKPHRRGGRRRPGVVRNWPASDIIPPDCSRASCRCSEVNSPTRALGRRCSG